MRELVITFGPSRSANYDRAVAYAKRYASSAEELEPGRWQATFELDAAAPALFARAGRLVAFTLHWRSTEMDLDGEPEVPWVLQSMAFCAHGYAKTYGECRFSFFGAVPIRCHPCPLFSRARADVQISAAERDAAFAGGMSLGLTPIEMPDGGVTFPEVPDVVPPEWNAD